MATTGTFAFPITTKDGSSTIASSVMTSFIQYEPSEDFGATSGTSALNVAFSIPGAITTVVSGCSGTISAELDNISINGAAAVSPNSAVTYTPSELAPSAAGDGYYTANVDMTLPTAITSFSAELTFTCTTGGPKTLTLSSGAVPQGTFTELDNTSGNAYPVYYLQKTSDLYVATLSPLGTCTGTATAQTVKATPSTGSAVSVSGLVYDENASDNTIKYINSASGNVAAGGAVTISNSYTGCSAVPNTMSVPSFITTLDTNANAFPSSDFTVTTTATADLAASSTTPTVNGAIFGAINADDNELTIVHTLTSAVTGVSSLDWDLTVDGTTIDTTTSIQHHTGVAGEKFVVVVPVSRSTSYAIVSNVSKGTATAQSKFDSSLTFPEVTTTTTKAPTVTVNANNAVAASVAALPILALAASRF